MAMTSHRVGAYILLAGGILLVFAGLAAALSFSLSGMIASAAAITALLYAGGVWFGGSPRVDASVVLFTPQLTVAAGPLTGRAVVDLFPIPLHTEIDRLCRAALSGESRGFLPEAGEPIEAAPVRAADGAIVYGVLIAGGATSERAVRRRSGQAAAAG
jgi:hypothetical protein